MRCIVGNAHCVVFRVCVWCASRLQGYRDGGATLRHRGKCEWVVAASREGCSAELVLVTGERHWKKTAASSVFAGLYPVLEPPSSTGNAYCPMCACAVVSQYAMPLPAHTPPSRGGIARASAGTHRTPGRLNGVRHKSRASMWREEPRQRWSHTHTHKSVLLLRTQCFLHQGCEGEGEQLGQCQALQHG